jgi:hypothetical protein
MERRTAIVLCLAVVVVAVGLVATADAVDTQHHLRLRIPKKLKKGGAIKALKVAKAMGGKAGKKLKAMKGKLGKKVQKGKAGFAKLLSKAKGGKLLNVIKSGAKKVGKLAKAGLKGEFGAVIAGAKDLAAKAQGAVGTIEGAVSAAGGIASKIAGAVQGVVEGKQAEAAQAEFMFRAATTAEERARAKTILDKAKKAAKKAAKLEVKVAKDIQAAEAKGAKGIKTAQKAATNGAKAVKAIEAMVAAKTELKADKTALAVGLTAAKEEVKALTGKATKANKGGKKGGKKPQF